MASSDSHGMQTVHLCANRRLVEQLEVAALSASNEKRIERPPVFTWQDWLQQNWNANRDLRALSGGDALPLPVGEALRLVLWEKAVHRALDHLSRRISDAEATAPLVLAGERRLAEGMAQAYTLALEYGIAPEELSQAETTGALLEQRLFAAALGHYRKALEEHGWIDPAELAAKVSAALAAGTIAPPAVVKLHGFRSLSPALQQLREVLTARGTKVMEHPLPERESANTLRRLADPRTELRAAARWARQRLEANPQTRVAIVVGDLHRRRSEVLAILDEELCPWRPPGAPRPYAISLGAPLAEWFPVREALAWLHWLLAPKGLPLPAARACLLSGAWRAPDEFSPATGEWLQREMLPVAVTPDRFGLGAIARKAQALQKRDAPPHRWVEDFRALLDEIGFPGPGSLASDAFQARERLEETLAQFSTLSALLDKIGAQEALARLESLCRARLFQPQGPAARLQVLGPLEAVGLSFDCAWIAGLNEGRFPPPREPDPFLPFSLQQGKGMPGTDPGKDAEHDRQWWRTLLGIAPAVEASFAEREEDQPLLPSWLIAGTAAESSQAEPLPDLWRRLRKDTKWTEVEDRPRPRLPDGALLTGGVGRFRDHFDCPFRGFALGELSAGRPSDPRLPPDARERGLLIHRIMARLAYEAASPERDQTREASEAPQGAPAPAAQPPSPQTLAALRGKRLETIVAEEIARFFGERDRRRHLDSSLRSALTAELRRRIEALLEQERQRPATITILAVEGRPLVSGYQPPAELALGGARVELRCDRIDRLPCGALAVIDYKSRQARGPGRGNALADPQLPLYALLDQNIRAVVYARLDGESDRTVFSGVAAERGWFPNARIGPPAQAEQNWFERLRDRWREQLEAAAQAIVEGRFAAAPRPGACRRCDLAALCRIGERWQSLAADPATEGEEP